MKPKSMNELKQILREYPFLIDKNCTMPMKKAIDECSGRADASADSLYKKVTGGTESMEASAEKSAQRFGEALMRQISGKSKTVRIKSSLVLRIIAAFVLVSSFVIMISVPPGVSYAKPELSSIELTERLSRGVYSAVETIPHPTVCSLYRLPEFGTSGSAVPLEKSYPDAWELAYSIQKRLVVFDNPEWELISAAICTGADTHGILPYLWHTELCYKNADGHTFSILQKWHGGVTEITLQNLYIKKASHLLDGSYMVCGMYTVLGKQHLSGTMFMPDSIAYIEYSAMVGDSAAITPDEVFGCVKYIGENTALTEHLEKMHGG